MSRIFQNRAFLYIVACAALLLVICAIAAKPAFPNEYSANNPVPHMLWENLSRQFIATPFR